MDLFIYALRAWQTALRMEGARHPDVYSNLVHLRMFVCDWDDWDRRYLVFCLLLFAFVFFVFNTLHVYLGLGAHAARGTLALFVCPHCSSFPARLSSLSFFLYSLDLCSVVSGD